MQLDRPAESQDLAGRNRYRGSTLERFTLRIPTLNIPGSNQ